MQAAFSAGVQVFEQPDFEAPALSLQQALPEVEAFLSEQQALAAGAALSELTFSVWLSDYW
ncbi:MAG: hypothetical protein IPH45_16815 [Bacteroidales bacterium]|nr:hypothetical protein [Bacteroidales bacterium]